MKEIWKKSDLAILEFINDRGIYMKIKRGMRVLATECSK